MLSINLLKVATNSGSFRASRGISLVSHILRTLKTRKWIFEFAIGWHGNMEADREEMQQLVAAAECGVCSQYCIYEIGIYGMM